MRKNSLFALATLIGTIVGAGIFGVPYAISKSGIIPGLFYFFILGGVVLLIHLFFGEIIFRTKEKHRLIGYTQKYLGDRGKIFITISTIVGLVGALLVYTIIGGDFLKIVFSPWINLPSFCFSLFFLLVLSYFIFRGIKIIAPVELLTNLLFFLIVFIVFCFGLSKVNFQNFTLVNPENLFLPYGIILFALGGWTAIPEISEILKNSEDRRSFKKIIVLTTIIAILIYLLFAFTVLGVSGQNTSTEALQGLVPFLGQKIIFFGALAAVITLADSFLIIGLSLRNTLIYDYKIPKIFAASLSCGLPLILFLIGFRNFIETIGFLGTLIGVIEGIIIILIFKKAKEFSDREPEYSLEVPSFLIYFLMLIFILGAISQIFLV